ncbi:hypothetical protein O6H91_05G125900 [Diphasiastrum complanatum]|uniref:Uncharacterized protein n=1 Tax=Diphasiastrum complanatum TaxID=34168 RepID=A0ACC2DSV2_DIPCM|nr:hypothetical protein O6H91_05G125900 [Diphasiastrum complanatum]
MILRSLVKLQHVPSGPLKHKSLIFGPPTLSVFENKTPNWSILFTRKFRNLNFKLICSSASQTGTDSSPGSCTMQKSEGSMNEVVEREGEMEQEIVEKLGPPPEEPLPESCCGNGCRNCVWDMYFDKLERYNKRKEAIRS